jgi:O-antigen biosynthesis protein
VQDNPAALIYSDEDMVSADGRRMDPVFKPAWSPELLLATMYLSHFLVISQKAFKAADGFRGVCDGAEYLDLCLRVTEADERVTHIPRILYHARHLQGGGDAGLRPAARRALNDAVHRRKWNAEVADGASPGTFRVMHETQRLASIIICSRSPKLLRSALKAIRSTTTYPAYEVVVAEHCPDGENPRMAAIAAEYECTRVPVGGPFNFSAINNVAAEYARGEILVFLNDDVEPLRAEWLSSIASGLEPEAVGIVGAKLLYPSGAIQHAGVVVGMGDGAGHVNRYKYRGDYWRWVDETRDVSAVTGACLGIRAELFRRLGGFNADFPNNYNDVDLCLRVREKGYRVVYEPGALLRHYEGQTRKLYVDYAEREKFYLRWHRVIEEGDPYYSPGLTTDDQEPTPNFRAVQPLPGAR